MKPFVRIVHIWLFDSAGRLLICKRPENAKSLPGVWTSSAGGHVEDGESYEEAARRELREELGISPALEHLFLLHYDRLTDEEHIDYIDVWRCGHSGEELAADPREIAEMRFISMEELADEITNRPQEFSPEFAALVEKWNQDKRWK